MFIIIDHNLYKIKSKSHIKVCCNEDFGKLTINVREPKFGKNQNSALQGNVWEKTHESSKSGRMIHTCIVTPYVSGLLHPAMFNSVCTLNKKESEHLLYFNYIIY